MFLSKLLEKNRPLAETALQWQQTGVIDPDTYVLDLDMIRANAVRMKEEADKNGVQLYFMLKQLGRNPLVAKMLSELGYAGAVCVDYREADIMRQNGIPLGNVGHLVQTPCAALSRILAARPDIITVYTLEKARQVGEAAAALGMRQPVMLRVLGKNDRLYPGQYGGFPLEELPGAIKSLEKISGVCIAGVCSFPCFLYDEALQEIAATSNLDTVRQAVHILQQAGYDGLQVNLPSATCARSIPMIAAAGGTHGEPGHGLTGTTPYHADHDDAPELPAYVYVTEVSHTLGDKAYCYGGGHYRRGHLKHALVGPSLAKAVILRATPPSDESIDYHFELDRPCRVGDGVLMCFRTQIFVTRSEVAVATGLSGGHPQLAGVWTATGQRIR